MWICWLSEWDPQSDREILCERVSGGRDWEAERGEPQAEDQLLTSDPEVVELLSIEFRLSRTGFHSEQQPTEEDTFFYMAAPL